MSIGAKIALAAAAFLIIGSAASAQSVRPGVGERIFIHGGVADAAVENKGGVNLGRMTPDSLYKYMAAIDSLRADGILFDRALTDSLVTAMIDRNSPTGDSLTTEQLEELVAERKQLTLNSSTVRHFMDDRGFLNRYIGNGVDTLLPKLLAVDTVGLSKRQIKQLARRDTTRYRYNRFFRDSMKLSPVIAISLVAPGFSQFYNEQYWKIPVLYGTVAAGIGVGLWQTSKYKPYKRLYDYHLARPPQKIGDSDLTYDSRFKSYKNTMNELQSSMIKHNTYRQLAFGFAAISYIYFLVDGTVNYPSHVNNVKKATTLATVCPGAGQFYNGTYWKVPIVMGGFGALIYCIDFNNRGYQRFKRAYNYRTDDSDETVDEFFKDGKETISAEQMLTWKNNYRRNRDLCIILTGLFYIVQIVDAHATAHMKTYDISDDLTSIRLEPWMDTFYTASMGNVNTFGLSLSLRF